jgi:DNA-nicking Smr family endonuclease
VKKKDDITKLDKESWDNFTKNPKNIFDKDLSNSKSKKLYSRYKLDLHGYTLSQANTKIKEIIFLCCEKKIPEILLITGKGIHSNTEQDVFVSRDLSKLRYSIPDYINSQSDLKKKISSVNSASKEEGGNGALIIKLK